MTGRSGGPGVAVALWVRHEVAGRWRALVVLGVLAGLAGGVAMATVAGSRRTATAYQRFRQETAAPDVIVFATQVQVLADYTKVRSLPEVIDAGEFTLAPIALKEFPDIGTLSPSDDHLYRTISKPLLVSGRLPDARRTDEVLVNRIAAKRFHIRVGQRVTLQSSSTAFSFNGSPKPDGPSVAAIVVGIGDSNMDLLFFANDPAFEPSGGFLNTYGSQVSHPGNLVVRLRPGTDVRRFREEVANVLHLPDVPVRDQAADNNGLLMARI